MATTPPPGFPPDPPDTIDLRTKELLDPLPREGRDKTTCAICLLDSAQSNFWPDKSWLETCEKGDHVRINYLWGTYRK